MKEILVSEKNALLETENEYIVAVGYDRETQSWEHGHYFSFWLDKELKPKLLRNATEYFLSIDIFDYEYIYRDRMEEIAALAIQNLDEVAMEYFLEDAQLEDYEKEYFCIKESEVE